VLRRSRWFNEDVLAAVSADMVSAYVDATGDLMELPLRGRWPGARVIARCEDVIQCCISVSSFPACRELMSSHPVNETSDCCLQLSSFNPNCPLNRYICCMRAFTPLYSSETHGE
jgi:hypothetical protein